MTLTLFNAITLDGFIAGLDDDTSWVKDGDLWTEECKKYDCVIYGRRTYDQMVKDNSFPLEGTQNIVYTSNFADYQKQSDQAMFTNMEPKLLLEELKKEGHKKVMIAGGGHVNATFAQAGVIDELYLDIHPIVLGKGIRFIEADLKIELELLDSKQLHDGLMLMHYRIKKLV